jgi:SPP1 family predicted phage head-tail adaptor
MKPFSVNDLRERITLQREILTNDGLGGGVRSVEEIATVWAEVTPLASVETVDGNGVESQTNWRIRIRWRNDITSASSILYGTDTLTIVGVHDDASSHHYAMITARQGGAH